MKNPFALSSAPEDREYRRRINAWCLYDWANSAFATTIMAAVMQVFFVKVAGAGVEKPDSYWAFSNSLSMLAVALLAPILGAIADHSAARKKFLAAFAFLGIVATAFMYFISLGDIWLAAALYIFGRIGFAGANVFYDSMLPIVARPSDIDQVSTRGFAIGYLGGGLLLAVNVWMIAKWGGETGARLSFVTVAAWWLVFSIPLFRRVPEPAIGGKALEAINPVKAGFRRLRKTLREIRRYRELFKFLLAFWLYGDGIGTIMVMASAFAAQLELPTDQIVGAILLVQFIGVPCAFLFGGIAKRIGAKRGILIGLVVYTLIASSAFLISKTWHFWLLAIAVGTVQGGTQALSRSLFGVLSPNAKTSEFFGFYSVSAKFAGIVGPSLYGLMRTVTGPNLAAMSLVVFFIAGIALLLRVDVQEGVRVAREENERAAAEEV